MRVLYVSVTGASVMGAASVLHYALESAKLGATVGMFSRNVTAELAGVVTPFAIGSDWSSLRSRIRRLRAAIKDFRPDIVHVYWHPGCELYPLACGAGVDPVWVADSRSPVLESGLRGLAFRVSARAAAHTFDRLAAHAAPVGRAMFGSRAVAELPPGYDDRLFRPREVEPTTTTGPLRMVYVGTLNPLRRVATVLEDVVKAATAPGAAASRGLIVDVYGSGGDAARIQDLAARASGTVRLLGFLPPVELAACLRDYDVGLSVIPNSVYRDAPPLKTIEYLGSGVPVIATDSPGNRMFVTDGVNGWLVGPGSRDLGAVVSELLAGGVPETMRREAAGSVRAYRWSTIVRDRVMPFYADCLGTRSDRGPGTREPRSRP